MPWDFLKVGKTNHYGDCRQASPPSYRPPLLSESGCSDAAAFPPSSFRPGRQSAQGAPGVPRIYMFFFSSYHIISLSCCKGPKISSFSTIFPNKKSVLIHFSISPNIFSKLFSILGQILFVYSFYF